MELMRTPTLDRENAFMLYATFCGDVVRTAAALNVDAMVVLRMVDEERWTEKLKGILELKKSGRPGDIERAINRALNFCQAHKMRLVVERAIRYFTDMDVETFEAQLLSPVGRMPADGSPQSTKLSTRALADLATALEKVQSMTYQALNDTTQERTRRKEETGADAAGDMHARIAQAMADAGASASPRAQLFDAQVRAADELAARQVEHERLINHPNDNDDH